MAVLALSANVLAIDGANPHTTAACPRARVLALTAQQTHASIPEQFTCPYFAAVYASSRLLYMRKYIDEFTKRVAHKESPGAPGLISRPVFD